MDWCEANCLHNPPYCPPSFCRCSSPGENKEEEDDDENDEDDKDDDNEEEDKDEDDKDEDDEDEDDKDDKDDNNDNDDNNEEEEDVDAPLLLNSLEKDDGNEEENHILLFAALQVDLSTRPPYKDDWPLSWTGQLMLGDSLKFNKETD